MGIGYGVGLEKHAVGATTELPHLFWYDRRWVWGNRGQHVRIFDIVQEQ